MSFFHSLLYSAGEALEPLAETDENLAFSLRTDWLSTMLQEGGGADGVPLTAVTTDGDTVGTIYDMSTNAMILRSETSGAQPVLGSDAEVSSFLTFDGVNDRLTVLSSISLLNPMWSANPVFHLAFKVKFNGGDGVTQRIFSNEDGLATNTGLTVVKGAANTITLRAPYSSSPNFVWTVTSTTTFTASTGWRLIVVSCDGVGAAKGRFVVAELDGTIVEDKTFTVNATGISANSTYNLNIGATESGAGFLNASLADIRISTVAITTEQITTYSTTNYSRQTTRFAPIIQYLIDMDNTSFIFSDTGATTPAVDNAAVRAVRNNQLGNFGHTLTSRRQLSSTTVGTSPLWKDNIINGRGALLFDGTDDNLDLLNPLCEEKGGKYTLFLVAQNNDATNGSHILKGVDYIALTGSDYTGEFQTNPYFAVHNTFPASVSINSKGAGVDNMKLLAYRRDGDEIKAWNGDKQSNVATSTAECYFTDMGDPNAGPGAAWRLHGYVCYLLKYNGAMTDAEIEAKIDELNTLFAI